MNLTRDRLHTIGWGTALAFCFALTLALTFRVNAVKSEVHLADRQLVELQQENMFLQTEFETRANQQQLKALNDVDFGYEAPTAGQYLESERQLAMLGKPAAPDAPSPIRVADADAGANAPQSAPHPALAMVSPLTGKFMGEAVAAEVPHSPHKGTASPAHATLQRASLRERLSRLDDHGIGAGMSRE